jgi:hypothetical protein
MIGYIQAAFTQWSNVSAVTFYFKGLTNHAIDNLEDNLVVIGWVESNRGFSGQAGPSYSTSTWYSDHLSSGYMVYVDGVFKLTSSIFIRNDLNSSDLISTISHELGHLLGFGHSDNPDSILYANYAIYGGSSRVEKDDLLGAQSVYGKPDVFVPFTQKTFIPPTTLYKTAPKSTSIVKMKQKSPSEWDDLGVVTTIDASITDDISVFGKIEYRGMTVGTQVEVITVKPTGIEIERRSKKISYTDSAFYTLLPERGIMRVMPGKWKQYGIIDNKLSFTLDFYADFPPITWNKPPEVTVNMQKQTAGSFKLIVQATDPEKDQITVTWHAPGQKVVSDIVTTGRVEKSFSYPKVGAYDLFVAVTDDAPRYSGSGVGFRKIINQQWIVNARESVPSYFVSEGILHLPALQIGSERYSAVLKTTRLPGTVLKLLDLKFLGKQNNPSDKAAYYNPATKTLTLPEVDVISSTNQSEIYKNVTFKLIENSDPIKVMLTSWTK